MSLFYDRRVNISFDSNVREWVEQVHGCRDTISTINLDPSDWGIGDSQKLLGKLNFIIYVCDIHVCETIISLSSLLLIGCLGRQKRVGVVTRRR